MKHNRTRLFALLLLAILASIALVACGGTTSLNANPLNSGCAFNEDGTPSYCRLMVVYNETTVNSGRGNGQVLSALPSVNGVSAPSAISGFESLDLGIDLPKQLNPDKLLIDPAVYTEYRAAGTRNVQIEARISLEGKRTLRLVGNGVEVFTATINSDGAELAINMLLATNIVLPEHQYSVRTILEAAVASDADFDLGFVLPQYFGTNHRQMGWSAQKAAAKDDIVWTPPSSYLAAQAEEAAQAAIDAAKVTVTIGSGEGPWSVAQRAAAQGKNFDCVFQLLEDHRASGGSWRAGHPFEIPPGTCDGGPTQLGATVLGAGN